MAVRVTKRDIRLIRDIALSSVLSRDQIIALGYFGSVPRANDRLRLLREAGLIDILSLPYESQRVYYALRGACPLVGERVSSVIRSRRGSPQFVRHALMTTEIRLALLRQGYGEWRFEPQLRSVFLWAGRRFEVRPDGMVRTPPGLLCIETDLGHVDSIKFRAKLLAFDSFASSGALERTWQAKNLVVETVTVSERRKLGLEGLSPKNSPVEFRFTTFDELGIRMLDGWS